MARRHVAVLLVATAASTSLAYGRAPAGPTQSTQSSLVAALDAYGDGRAARLAVKSIDDLRSALKGAGHAWVESGPAGDRQRRRHVLALVALDGAIGASPSEAASINALLEWACWSFRADKPTEFERTWMLSSIAFAESERQEAFLLGGACAPSSPACNHVRHAISRFPDDPRFAAARVFGRVEVNVVTRRPVGSASLLVRARPILYNPVGPASAVPSAADEKRVAETIAELRQLSSDPIVGPIARVRIGILHYELRQFDQSRHELSEALRVAADPFLAYFAHLVTGLGFDSENRTTDAPRAFAAAVAVDPGVVSGALELAAHDFGLGRRAEGSAVLDRALAATPTRDDPWQRPCPDCGGWTGRREELRAWVRR